MSRFCVEFSMARQSWVRGMVMVVVAQHALAAEGDWETVVTGPLVVKNRALPDSAIKEIWAEGEMNAPAIDIQDALMRVDRLNTFMPYVKEAREISAREGNSVYVYTLIELPVVGRRDYVERLTLVESLKNDGTGTFRNEWRAFPDYAPRRAGVIRLIENRGSWVVTPLGPEKSWVVYKFAVDPGGWIPAFAANMGNERGVKETYDAVTREAQRRKRIRLDTQKGDAGVVGSGPRGWPTQ